MRERQSRLGAPEQIRRQREIAVFGKSVGDATHLRGNAENFLQHDHRVAVRPVRNAHVGIEMLPFAGINRVGSKIHGCLLQNA